jgi:hypothetical protein
MIMFHMKHFLYILLDFKENASSERVGTHFAAGAASCLSKSLK